MAVRACCPTSGPYNSKISSEQPLMTAVVCVNPGATFTNPLTISHAITLSRSPSSRFKVPRIDSVARRAAWQACSNVTSSLPTLPSGPAIEPSGF